MYIDCWLPKPPFIRFEVKFCVLELCELDSKYFMNEKQLQNLRITNETIIHHNYRIGTMDLVLN
jgi:hypothetical protein